ncbi:MAG: hypothetical protein KME37_18170 [Candidatus Thiodiazotropha sp. (ex Codakia orbicularis)]|nr:hypothetical protein [Candidatus Thiodiazotropha sp. (ex Codakia orbicularis)]
MTKPIEVVDKLIGLFPGFEEEWDGGEGFGYENDNFSMHSVFLTFGPVSNELLNKATEKQIKSFCSFINDLVKEGGNSENAVSTCFLEHASQLKVRSILKPYLCKEAKGELR